MKGVKNQCWMKITILFFLMNFLFATEPFILEFLQENQQQENTVGTILQQTEGEKRYNSLEEYVLQHPENLLAQYWLMKMSFDLGTPNHLRKFYLTQLRFSNIQSKSATSSSRYAVMVWHYCLGMYHARLHGLEAKNKNPIHGSNQNFHAALGLHHLQESLRISSDFLPAWIQAKNILSRVPNAKNQLAIQVCQYHIARIWNQPDLNPTFFRVYIEGIPNQKIEKPSQPKPTSTPFVIQQPFAQFLEDNLQLANWLPENTVQEVRTFLQACQYYYEQGQRLDESNAEAFQVQGLTHSKNALERVFSILYKDAENAEKYIPLEKLVRQYLANFYMLRKEYALAEEQSFILDYVLR